MRRLIPLLVVLLLALAACGGDDAASTTVVPGSDGSYTSTTFASTTTRASDGEAPTDEDTSGRPGGSTDAHGIVTTAVDLGRKIVFTATVEVEVADVTAAVAEVRTILTGLGGIVFGQETTIGDSPRSVITIKVPPANFEATLGRLAGVGRLLRQSVFADDVTERVVDLESRIATAETSVLRLRRLLEAAPSLEDVVLLEKELLQRETDLELLRGQLRTVEDQVALATIVLILTEPSLVPEPSLEMVQTIAFGSDPGACPGLAEVEIDEGEPMVVCFVVTNTGDTLLGSIEPRDNGLGIRPRDLTVVSGDATVPLAPDERIVFAYTGKAEANTWVSPSVSAMAVDADGAPLRFGVGVEIEPASFRVIPDTSLPGFGDALATAWNGMLWFLGVIVLIAGGAIPFLWVPAIGLGIWWWQRRRRRREAPPAN